ncbi:hypothetical protein KJ866_04395 [Patescibacteria group bacterium]|nr:hypothetical protein [Patescibacteria group bacterium]MBU2219855.1 hypothetical protein [Patescibacteria group bacterium]MBU2264738.1 hypothetical protein [Patescibacteria group bacterium]
MKGILPIIIVVLIIAGLGLWWQFGVKNSVTNFEECVAAGNPVMEIYPRQCQHQGQTFVEEVSNLFNREIRTFTDRSLGISFAYPKEFGEGKTEIFMPGGKRPAGSAGEKLAGTFSEFPDLEFGGITDDFNAGREGLLTDTRGFSKQNDKYYFKFVSEKPDLEIQPLKIISKDFGEILIIDDQSFEAERNYSSDSEGPVLGVGAGRLAGLVNLKSAKFPGIVFYNWDTAKLSPEDFEAILHSLIIMDPEVETFIQSKDPVNYSIDVPIGWFSYENGPSTIFTQNPNLKIPANTESYAIGPNFYITVNNLTDIDGVISYDQWLDKNGFLETNELFIKSSPVQINGLEMLNVITEGAGVAGEVMHYVYFADVQHVVTLSQFPYDPQSDITQVFEGAVRTFRVPEQQGSEGILPFDSGAQGQILLGPTCPVMKDPPDPDCLDKPYQATVQVIAIGSSKSSPFSTVGTDKEGRYKVMLPPGFYGLQAVGRIPFPSCGTKEITVEPGVVQQADLFCDTGIR